MINNTSSLHFEIIEKYKQLKVQHSFLLTEVNFFHLLNKKKYLCHHIVLNLKNEQLH